MDNIEHIIFITLLLHSGYCNKIILHKKKICTTDFALYLQSTEICTQHPNLYLRPRIHLWKSQTVAAVFSTFSCCKDKIQLQIFIKYFPIFLIPTESCYYSLTACSFQMMWSGSLPSLLKNGQIFWMVPI